MVDAELQVKSLRTAHPPGKFSVRDPATGLLLRVRASYVLALTFQNEIPQQLYHRPFSTLTGETRRLRGCVSLPDSREATAREEGGPCHWNV